MWHTIGWSVYCFFVAGCLGFAAGFRWGFRTGDKLLKECKQLNAESEAILTDVQSRYGAIRTGKRMN